MKKHSLRVLAAVLSLLMLASVFTGLSVSAAGITFTVQNVTIGGCLYPVPNADPYAMKSTIYGNAGDEGADVVDFWWFNETAGARVPDNGSVKFQSNNVYTLNVVIKAVELDEDSNSYTFPNSFKSTRFWFSNNNNERGNATATQYEDKPLNQYRLLSWTSLSLPEIKITELRLEGVKTVLNPDTQGLIAGKPVSDLTASAGNLVDSEGVPIAGGSPNYVVTKYETCVWTQTDVSTWEWVAVTNPEATFEVGKKYMMRATLTANDPYYFSTNASGKPNVDAVWAYGPTSAFTMTNSKIETTNRTNDTLTLTYQFPEVSAVKIPVTSPYASFYSTPHYFDKIDCAKLAPLVSEGFTVEEVKVSKWDKDAGFYKPVEDGTYIGDVESIFTDLGPSGLNVAPPRYQVVAKLKLGEGYSITPEELDKFGVYGGYDVNNLTTDDSEDCYCEFYENAGFYWVKYYFYPTLDPDMVYSGVIWYKNHGIKGGSDADDAAAALLSDASLNNYPYYYGPEGTIHSVEFLDAEGEVFHQTLVGGETYTLRSEILYPNNTKIYEPTSLGDKNYWFENIPSDLSYPGRNTTTIGTFTDAYGKTYKKVTVDTPVKVATNFKAGESCEWKFDSATGTLEIKGTGDMYDYKMLDTKPWDGFKDDIKKVVIEDGVTSVGKFAFNGCENLAELTIADSVTKIGGYAFQNDTKLAKVTLSSKLVEIGSSAFENDSALTEITIPSMVTTIGDHAFENTGLTSVAIPDAVKTIGAGAFQNVKLAEINLPAALTEIGEFAFVGATDKEVTVPESVTSIGAYALGYSSVKQIPGEGDAPSTWEGTPVEGFKIVAQAGTAAYRYATSNNITVERTNFVVKFDNKLEYEIMGETFKYGSVQEKFCAADEEITIPKQITIAYDMYTFGGWKIEGEDTIYQGGETYKVTKDVTFKAIWTSTPVVTYEDGNGNKRTDVVPSTGEYKFMRCYFTAPEGKVFAGWKIAETVYQPGDTLTVTESLTATAIWADAVTITFDANGGTGEMAAVKVAKDSEFTFPECDFTAPEGKVFAGWKVEGLEKIYLVGDKYTLTQDVKFVAVWTDPPVDITGFTVEGIKNKIYTGKALTQSVVVKNGETVLVLGTDYEVEYNNNKNVGTATVIISGKGAYTGTITKTFKINKAKNPMTVKASKKTVKYKKLAKKKITVKAITVKKAQGKVTYKKVKAAKGISINKKTGKITFKKGMKKGTYKIKVKVTAKGTANYKSGSKTVTVTIKVK